MSWALKRQNRKKHTKQIDLKVFPSPVKMPASRIVKGPEVFFCSVLIASKSNELDT
jgi:hypothetical protein